MSIQKKKHISIILVHVTDADLLHQKTQNVQHSTQYKRRCPTTLESSSNTVRRRSRTGRHSNTRSRRSDTLKTAQDGRPPPTDDLTGRPIRHTVQAFWNTLEHHACLQNRPTSFHNSSDPGQRWTNIQRIAEVERLLTLPPASIGHDGSANGNTYQNVHRSMSSSWLTFRLPTRALFKEDRWPSDLSGLQVRSRAVRTSGRVARTRPATLTSTRQ